MNAPSRFEIEKLANEIFQLDLGRRTEEYAQKQKLALAEDKAKRNIDGFVQTLIRCKKERLRAEILAFADGLVEAGLVYGVPLPRWAESALEKKASEITAGVISSFVGEIALHATRVRIPSMGGTGRNEIANTMKSAYHEGRLRLKVRRIQTERAAYTSTNSLTIPTSRSTGDNLEVDGRSCRAGTVPDQTACTVEHLGSTGTGEKTAISAQPPIKDKHQAYGPSEKDCHLSERDAGVHRIVGADNFRNLTNADIMNDRKLAQQLRAECNLQPRADATKSCLDRVRRAMGYPLSKKISQRRSTRL